MNIKIESESIKRLPNPGEIIEVKGFKNQVFMVIQQSGYLSGFPVVNLKNGEITTLDYTTEFRLLTPVEDPVKFKYC